MAHQERTWLISCIILYYLISYIIMILSYIIYYYIDYVLLCSLYVSLLSFCLHLRSLERIKSGIGAKDGAKNGKEEECWAPPGEELVACEQVTSWLRRAKSSDPLEFSDMAVPLLSF